MKLAKELSRSDTGNTLYILDEPTTGLHFADVDRLVKVLNHLVDLGNSVFVIEHNMDVIKNCDYIVDMGPEGGAKGGKVIACGSVKEVAKNYKKTGSYTCLLYTSRTLPIPPLFTGVSFHAKCENWLSHETAITSIPRDLNSSYLLSNAIISLGQTKVKSIG